jgi:biotin carboxyl carrier protein
MKTTLHLSGIAYTVEYTQSGDEYEISVNGVPLRARVLDTRNSTLILTIDGKPLRAHLVHDGPRTLVAIAGQVYEFTRQEKQAQTRRGEAGRLHPEVRSPMPGKILEVLVTEGAEVEAGQALILLEAMKMENTLAAEGAAKVNKIHVSAGDLVDLGQLLVELAFIDAAPSSPQAS